MNHIITDSNGLVKTPHDPYWDGPVTRREAQGAINALADNDRILTMCNDTVNIAVNFLLEKLGVTRGELNVYVEKKKAEVAKVNEALKASAEKEKQVLISE